VNAPATAERDRVQLGQGDACARQQREHGRNERGRGVRHRRLVPHSVLRAASAMLIRSVAVSKASKVVIRQVYCHPCRMRSSLHVVFPLVDRHQLAACLSSAQAGLRGGLPADVAAALDRAKLPRDALVAVVQEVGAGSSRLSWQPLRPVNPASLMKLLTTAAALELLGPGWSWSTPVWMQGTVHEGVLEGNLVIKGSGDPKLVLERVWLLLRRVQQLGVREIRGDIVLDRSAFDAIEGNPGGRRGPASHNVQADALLNYRSLLITFTPDARGVAIVAVEPTLAGVRADATVPSAPRR
jgi:D-alanyl-D-alanine carboxypeptidase/D-alanyl-D-alanine-endopeptidase (penicillin-binding protein 4)